MATSTIRILRWAQVVRIQAMLARVAQTRTFVGRKIQASAASGKHWWRLQDASAAALIMRSGPFFKAGFPGLGSVEGLVHFHGHSSSATIVRVVSRQLDNVLVEQNHCQGFRTVAASYHTINIWYYRGAL